MCFGSGFSTRKLVFFALLIVTCLVISYNTELFKEYLKNPSVYENISSCYNNTGDILPPIEESTFRPPPKSIFFHETSYRDGLEPRQACAVEAAAAANPDWIVHVLFLGPVKKLDESLKTLQTIKNIRLARVHFEEYVNGTPVEDVVTSGALYRSQWRVSHTSDFMRYLTLFKWGGVYLDLDTVAVKSFNSLKKNWSARESDTAVAAGAMSFSQDDLGRNIASKAIRNDDLHRDLQIEIVEEVINTYAEAHQYRLHHHVNVEAIQLLDVIDLVRRLKRTKPFELV